MSGGPVDPADVPVFTGDLDVLEAKTKALSHGGSKVRTAGSDVHKSFGGLAAFYKAPEAEQLFGVTKPVERTAHDLSDDMHVIAGALGTYAREIRPLIHRLEQLKREAADFRDNEAAEDDWSEDGDLTDENLNRRNKIAEVWAAFQEAERDCHAKIVALVGGKALHTIDASHKKGYGYDAEALKASKSLPWGDAVEESVPWWQVWEHAYDFGKGFIVDGVGGTIDGIYTLFGGHGGEAAGEAWAGLAKLSTAVAITTTPGLNVAYWMTPGKMLPSWLRDSRTAVLDTGKALVAWDQWESNGSRAAGAVTFNIVTAIFTRGGGAAVQGAGKAGALAKGLSVVSKVGSAVDPMTYVIKGAGAGLSKVGDMVAHLKGLGHVETPKISEGAYSLPEGAVEMPDGTIQLPKDAAIPEGATKLPDGRIELPKGTVTFPPGTVKDPFTGKYMDPKTDLYNEDGSLFQRAEDAHQEKPATPTAGADNPRIETPAHQEQRVPAGVGGRGDDFTRAGSEVSDPALTGDNVGHGSAGPGDNTPTGRAGDGNGPGGRADNIPINSHSSGSDGSTSHTPGTGGLDNSTNGARHTDETNGTGSGGHGAGDGPSIPHQGDGPVSAGGGHDLPGTGSVDDLGHTGGDGTFPHEPESPLLPGGSEPRPDGARYVEEPGEKSAAAARFYDGIRSNPDSLDIRALSENTGVSTHVLARFREHFFLTEHAVAEGPGLVRHAYFTPRKDLADILQAASDRPLTGHEAIKFERFIAHEYVESHLLEAGVPYYRDHPNLWDHYANPDGESGHFRVSPTEAADAGAHELALSERSGGFDHWERMGFDVPKVEMSPNLTNIDEVIAALFEELRSKGIELQ
ncbi:hypothetical protein ACIQU1_28910 [Streptomyces angustmyceticus]|uniref:hypothetical protein n=1 Tax=Streptomyces angustmyceticus TaxID=285578 RepID=UPI0037FDFBA5